MSEITTNNKINLNLSKGKIDNNLILTSNDQDNNTNLKIDLNTNNNSSLTNKVSDILSYTQDGVSSLTETAQTFVENNPAFIFQKTAEQLKSSIVSGIYSTFGEVVDKVLLGAFRGVTLAFDAWNFIKKLKEKNKLKQELEKLNNQIKEANLEETKKAEIDQKINKLLEDIDENKMDLGVSGGRVITDLLGVVGAIAGLGFLGGALATAAPYLIGVALVGDIAGISYYAYKAIKNGVNSFQQKLAQRRELEMKQKQTQTQTQINT
ncbi:MAG: hypothetical protein N2485_05265 [bacterium]|nr:hypothetical protein [bacterium]